jgi:hypothetical protein
MSSTTANGNSKKHVLEKLMAKVRSGTDQEVIEVLNAPIAPGTAFGDITLLDAISEIYGVTGAPILDAFIEDGRDESEYASVLEAEGAASDEGPLRKALFSILCLLARDKKQDAFEFLKGELSRRGITHVQITGTIYGMDWEALYNIDDAELRDKILAGECEDLVPSSCGKFSGRPYKRDCFPAASGGEMVAYTLQDLAYEDLRDSSNEVDLLIKELNCAWDGSTYQSDESDQYSSFSGFRHWITDDGSADPLDPVSLYGDRTKDADKFTLVIKLDPRLTASS